MKGRYKILAVLIILATIGISFTIIFSGSKLKQASTLVNVSCMPNGCTFNMKGTDEIMTVRLSTTNLNLQLNPQFKFVHSGIYNVPIYLNSGTVLNFILVMQQTGTITGSVIVQ